MFASFTQLTSPSAQTVSLVNNLADPSFSPGGCQGQQHQRNGQTDALTDGLLLLRYMFGLTGPALINNAVGANAQRNTSQLIEAYIATLTQ